MSQNHVIWYCIGGNKRKEWNVSERTSNIPLPTLPSWFELYSSMKRMDARKNTFPEKKMFTILYLRRRCAYIERERLLFVLNIIASLPNVLRVQKRIADDAWDSGYIRIYAFIYLSWEKRSLMYFVKLYSEDTSISVYELWKYWFSILIWFQIMACFPVSTSFQLRWHDRFQTFSYWKGCI